MLNFTIETISKRKRIATILPALHWLFRSDFSSFPKPLHVIQRIADILSAPWGLAVLSILVLSCHLLTFQFSYQSWLRRYAESLAGQGFTVTNTQNMLVAFSVLSNCCLILVASLFICSKLFYHAPHRSISVWEQTITLDFLLTSNFPYEYRNGMFTLSTSTRRPLHHSQLTCCHFLQGGLAWVIAACWGAAKANLVFVGIWFPLCRFHSSRQTL